MSTTTTHIETEKQLVPAIRFKEFEGEWTSESFGQYVLHSAFGPRFSSGLYQKDGDIATLRTTDMDLDGNISYNTMPFARLTVEEVKDHILEQNDIVISRSGTIGITGIFKDFTAPVVPGAFLIRFRIDTKSVSSDFIKQNFNSPLGRHKLEALSAGGVQKNLTGTSVKKAEVNFPSLHEQQKIASFLSAVDEKIQQLTKKKALLEQYKKGVMQQLFSGQLRFKDENGKAYPDWEEKLLGEIGEFKTSSVDKKIVEGETLVKLVNYMNVYRHEEILPDNIDNLMVVSAKTNQLETSNLKKGDVLFTPSSETPDDIGHSVVIFKDLPNTLYSYHLMRFRPTIKLDLMYSHFFCNTADVLRQISRFATGSTRFTISVGNFSAIKLAIPCFEEQQKIASYLSGIDTKIAAVNNQITQTQTFKKGLLQQMFV